MNDQQQADPRAWKRTELHVIRRDDPVSGREWTIAVHGPIDPRVIDHLSRPPSVRLADTGDDWMVYVGRNPGWYLVPMWGAEGWDLGHWPYVIIAHHDPGPHDELVDADGVPLPATWSMATYVEGDIRVDHYFDRVDRDTATDQLAVDQWKRTHGPRNPSLNNPNHRGRYTIDRGQAALAARLAEEEARPETDGRPKEVTSTT